MLKAKLMDIKVKYARIAVIRRKERINITSPTLYTKYDNDFTLSMNNSFKLKPKAGLKTIVHYIYT